ncbi:MAG: DNA recombination protein RmuC, partial [Gammaproteobacteria bacterium]|nr:DNA recombination protein RmuC [Gammaproteobacteria bacterium]
MPTTLPETVAFDWVVTGGAAGLLLGLAIGLVIGWVTRIKLKARLEAREAELAARSDADSERERALSIAAERLRATFDELADQQFRSHSETFLKLARENLSVHHERARGDLAAREQAIENLVRPIREALQRTDAQIQELEKARRETHGGLQAQLEAMAASHAALSVETRNLVNALRRPEVRGQWGEITLRRLVELAGMVEHCDFTAQAHLATATGSIRPDLVINLPEGRQLVVDVKTPLDAYLEAVQAENETDRRAATARHAS